MTKEADFKPVVDSEGAMVEIAQSRVAQEVQASMIIARRFPRDVTAAFSRIMNSCKRMKLAEQSMYAYPRAGTTVTGPSIRLAEVLAQNWGNLDFGVIEIEQRGGESTVMAYAWDLETNVRQTKVFSVRHARFTKKSGIVKLSDPRDIYEMTANQGARRMRACILGVIPGDIVEAAVDQCGLTLRGDHEEPLEDRIRRMTTAFSELGVTSKMLESNLGHKLETTNEHELVKLRAIFRSVKDNMASIDSFFDRGQKPAETMKKTGKVEEGTGEDREHRMAAEEKAAAKKKPVTPQVAEGAGGATPLALPPDDADPAEESVEDLKLRLAEEGGEDYEPATGPKPDRSQDELRDDLQDALEPAPMPGGGKPPAETKAKDGPLGADDPPPKTPRKLTGSMLGRVHIGFRKLKIEDPDRLLYLKTIYGVDSAKNLSYDDAAGLIENLEDAAETGDITWISDVIGTPDE